MLGAVGEIWKRSRPKTLERVDTVERAIVALLEGMLDEELRRLAEREAHKLAGTVGTFGFAEGSRLARGIEQAFAAVDSLEPDSIFELSEQVLALRQELEREPSPGSLSPSGAHPPGNSPAAILLITPDAARGEPLVVEGVARQLEVLLVPSPAVAREKLAGAGYKLVVLDLSATDSPRDALALIEELAASTPPAPVLALVPDEVPAVRLEVVRRGGRCVLPASASPSRVMEVAADLLQKTQSAPATVLAVDDDPVMLETIRGTLAAAGLAVTTLDDPHRFWETLQSTAPDLLVLDLDMPGASGLELCRLVRSDRSWAELPIVFLTGYQDSGSMQEAFAEGADDFVIKPLTGPELAARVLNRLERTRLLRAQVETDPVTGLANRARGEREMERYHRLARRQGVPLSLALIELDFFRELVARHGHAVGDEVLRRFATLLRSSFRSEDVLARGEGGEFLVGMFGAQKKDGLRRLQDVLAEVRAEEFVGGDGTRFGVTFSAGLATHADDATELRLLHRAADQALFAAKAGGHDRVVAAGADGEEAHVERGIDVVLVEDDEALAALLMHALESRGYHAQWLQDGEHAAELLGGARPRLRTRAVLLDVDLPGLDGLSVLRRLASDGVLHGTRVIMLTIRATESEVVQALELGAWDHVAKPFSVPVLLQRLQRALEER